MQFKRIIYVKIIYVDYEYKDILMIYDTNKHILYKNINNNEKVGKIVLI